MENVWHFNASTQAPFIWGLHQNCWWRIECTHAHQFIYYVLHTHTHYMLYTKTFIVCVCILVRIRNIIYIVHGNFWERFTRSAHAHIARVYINYKWWRMPLCAIVQRIMAGHASKAHSHTEWAYMDMDPILVWVQYNIYNNNMQYLGDRTEWVEKSHIIFELSWVLWRAFNDTHTHAQLEIKCENAQ